MTTYIPSITIPTAVFQNQAASILLPVTLGLAVGYTTGREHPPMPTSNAAPFCI